VEWTVQSLADRLGLECRGDGSAVVRGVAELDSAGPDRIAFVTRAGFAEHIDAVRAAAVIVRPELAERVPTVALVSEHPHPDFARAAQLLHPEPLASGRRSPSAVVSADADVAADVDVGDHASIGAGSSVGPGTVVAPGAVIGTGVRIGRGCRIGARVVVDDGTVLGDAVRVQPGAVIGADGFGFAWTDDGWLRVPQLGRVVIGNDVEIGANTTIDRGALGDTVIGDNVLLDNQIQVAHNVRIGDYTAIAGCAGISGSVVIGRRCTIGGGVGIAGHLEVTDDVHITGMSLVTRSITSPGTYSSAMPIEGRAEWSRNAVRFRQLDGLFKRVKMLESNRDRGRGDRD